MHISARSICFSLFFNQFNYVMFWHATCLSKTKRCHEKPDNHIVQEFRHDCHPSSVPPSVPLPASVLNGKGKALSPGNLATNLQPQGDIPCLSFCSQRSCPSLPMSPPRRSSARFATDASPGQGSVPRQLSSPTFNPEELQS